MKILGEAFCRTVGGCGVEMAEIARERMTMDLGFPGKVEKIGLRVNFNMRRGSQPKQRS